MIVLLDISLTYWHRGYLIYELLSCGILFVLAVTTKDILLIKEIGKQSFAIYLLHMLFAGAVNTFFAKFRIEILLVLKPLILIGVVMIGIKVMKFVDKKAKLDGKLIYCFGVR
jgi:fucose 4-O-acetylase-like acetyltransferase